MALDLATGSPNGKTAISVLVDHGVRSAGALGGMPGGREFDLPYKKSLYVSRKPLPKQFCELLVNLVDRVYRADGLKVVFQAVIGGGAFKSNKSPATRMQQRESVVQIVFDVFYHPKFESDAVAFQIEMKGLWEEHLPRETARMFWATYEDPGSQGQLDMTRKETQDLYYEKGEYPALQKVKDLVDPDNVFRTSFTVQNP